MKEKHTKRSEKSSPFFSSILFGDTAYILYRNYGENMPKFAYLAKKNTGQLVKGTMEVINLPEAKRLLRTHNLKVISVRSIKRKGFKRFGGSVKPGELQVFSRQFAVLIESGVPIIESLKSISEGMANKAFRRALEDVIKKISTGRKLSEALALYPKIFNKLYVNLVRAGEEAGVL